MISVLKFISYFSKLYLEESRRLKVTSIRQFNPDKHNTRIIPLKKKVKARQEESNFAYVHSPPLFFFSLSLLGAWKKWIIASFAATLPSHFSVSLSSPFVSILIYGCSVACSFNLLRNHAKWDCNLMRSFFPPF